MTNQAAATLTAEITVSTIQFMADKVGISFEQCIESIIEGGNARKHFDALLATAARHVSKS